MQNNFYDQLEEFLQKSNMELAYSNTIYCTKLMDDIKDFLHDKSDDEQEKSINALNISAFDLKKTIKNWTYHPLTVFLRDRQIQSQQTLSKTIISDKARHTQRRKKKLYRSLDMLVDKEELDEIVKKLEEKGYINRSKKNEIRFIDPPLKKKATIRRLVIVGKIIIDNYLKTNCSDFELWIALTKYFNVTGNYQSFKKDERDLAEPYRKEFTFLLPN